MVPWTKLWYDETSIYEVKNMTEYQKLKNFDFYGKSYGEMG